MVKKSVMQDKKLGGYISENIKKLLEKSGLSVNQLSINTGLAFTTIKRIIDNEDTNPTIGSLELLADYFDISITDLLSDSLLSNQNSFIYSKRMKLQLIPLLKEEEIIDWPSNKASILEDEAVNSIHTDSEVSNDSYAFIAAGSTMEPAIPAKSILVIDPHGSLVNDAFVLVIKKGHLIPQIKQLILDGPDRYIRSLNLNILPNHPILIKDDEYSIIGVIKEIIRKV